MGGGLHDDLLQLGGLREALANSERRRPEARAHGGQGRRSKRECNSKILLTMYDIKHTHDA